MTGQLAGKVALVRGGDSAWAASAGVSLEQAGASVTLVRSEGEKRPEGFAGELLAGKFGDAASADSAVAGVVASHGRLDILVNLPGPQLFLPVVQVSDEVITTLLNEHVVAAFRWMRSAAARMPSDGHGRIITFVSGLAERGLVNGAAYSATQAAIEGITRSIALELARTSIRVNAIGFGWTEIVRTAVEQQQQDRLVRFLPLRRKGHPDDYMGLLTYLASDASDFVTGQTLHIDGGAMAHA
jgi:3-oxoacyl-[acyl-carrier protein] reductase